MRTNDGPEPAQNSLSHDKIVAKLGLALLVKEMQTGKSLPDFFVRRSFIPIFHLFLEGCWQPINKEFFKCLKLIHRCIFLKSLHVCVVFIKPFLFSAKGFHIEGVSPDGL